MILPTRLESQQILLFSNLLHLFTNLLPKFWSIKLSSRLTTFPSSCIPSHLPSIDGSFRYLIRFTGLCVSICSSFITWSTFHKLIVWCLIHQFAHDFWTTHVTDPFNWDDQFLSFFLFHFAVIEFSNEMTLYGIVPQSSNNSINWQFPVLLCQHYCPLVGFAGLLVDFACPPVVQRFLPLCLFNKFPSIKLSLTYVVWNVAFFLPLSSCFFWLWMLFFHM